MSDFADEVPALGSNSVLDFVAKHQLSRECSLKYIDPFVGIKDSERPGAETALSLLFSAAYGMLNTIKPGKWRKTIEKSKDAAEDLQTILYITAIMRHPIQAGICDDRGRIFQSMEKYYLVDFENVGVAGLAGIEKLPAESKVILFFSDRSAKVTSGVLHNILNAAAEIKSVLLKTSGRNALDFQLVAYLGMLIGQNAGGQYCIVSNDNGYTAAIGLLKEKHPALDIRQAKNLLPGVVAAKAKDSRGKNSMRVRPEPQSKSGLALYQTGSEDPLRQACTLAAERLGIHRENDLEKIIQAVRVSKSRMMLHNHLAQFFDGEMTTALYNELKKLPYFSKMRSSM